MADRFEYFYEVVETGRLDLLSASLNDLGRQGWRLVHVVPHTGGFAPHGDLLLVWERPLGARDEGGGAHGDTDARV